MHATVLGCRWVLAWFGEVAVVVFVIIHNKQLGQRRIDVLVLPCLIVRSWSPNSGIHLGHLQQRPGKMASKSEFGGGPENFGPQFHISSPARPPISAPKTVGPTYADSAFVSPTLCRARPCRRRALLRTESETTPPSCDACARPGRLGHLRRRWNRRRHGRLARAPPRPPLASQCPPRVTPSTSRISCDRDTTADSINGRCRKTTIHGREFAAAPRQSAAAPQHLRRRWEPHHHQRHSSTQPSSRRRRRLGAPTRKS
jgi:hypothetical protein